MANDKLINVEVVFYRKNHTVLAVQLVRVFSLGVAYAHACLIIQRDFPQTYATIQSECTAFNASITDKY